MGEQTSTLAYTEEALAPLVWLVLVACTLVGVVLLCVHAELVAIVAWLALVGSNALYLARHGRVSVGMAPPAVASLVPAAASALAGQVLPAWAWAACVGALVLSSAVPCVFVACFVRMRAAYRRHPAIAEDAVILVLGGAVKNGSPRPTLARRLDMAREVCAGHPRRTLVLTGGPLPNAPGTEAEAMARYLADKGVPREQLLLEPRARNTRQNVSYSCELLDKRGLAGQRCVLSSDYHLWRALREGRAAGVELTPIAAPTPAAGRLQQWCREALTILAGR